MSDTINPFAFWPDLDVIAAFIVSGKSLIVNVGDPSEIKPTLDYIESVVDYFGRFPCSYQSLGNTILVSTGANIHVTAFENRDLEVSGHHVLQTFLWRLMRGAIANAALYEKSKSKAPEKEDEGDPMPGPGEVRLEMADRPD